MMNTKINVSINSELRKKYGIRRFPIAKGDIVKIVSGSRNGEGGKVIEVNHKTKKISIEGITIAKADGKQVAFYVDHSNLVITKLDLSVEGRYNKIKENTVRRNLPVPEKTVVEKTPEEAVENTAIDTGVEENTNPEENLEESKDESEDFPEEEPEEKLGDDEDEN